MSSRRGRAPYLTAALAAAAFVALVASAAGLQDGSDAVAQTEGPSLTRVVFAIDNSGSMFNSDPDEEDGSDPDLHRITGVDKLIEAMKEDDKQREVEVGALLFGGPRPVFVLIPPTSVRAPDLSVGTAWDKRLIDVGEGSPYIGGGTDFRQALCAAWALVSGQPLKDLDEDAGCPDEVGGLDNLKAPPEGARLLVVLITDGSPATGEPLKFDEEPSPECENVMRTKYAPIAEGVSADQRLCELAKTWEVLGETRAVELAVIGLDKRDEWFMQAEPYWERVAQCGAPGQPECTTRVSRTLDELDTWILETAQTLIDEVPTATPEPSGTPTATATTTPTTTTTPTATPTPQPVPCSAMWEGKPGEAPRWRATVRLGFPLPIRFRDSAVWSVTVGPEKCEETDEAAAPAATVEADAKVTGCDACTASDTGAPPLTLYVPTAGLGGGSVERRVSWKAPLAGIEDSTTEQVPLVDSPILRTEPYWATILNLLALAAIAAGVSAVAVRMPTSWRSVEEPAKPLDLLVPDEYRRPVSIVRLDLFVWRRTVAVSEGGREEPGRLLTLRWLVFGPLVARDTSDGAPMRDLLLGRPTGEADSNEARRLDLRRRPRRRVQP